MPPRTIDNLGMEVSTRYAQDQKLIDSAAVKESRGIHSQTEIEVTAPSFPSELDALIKAQPEHLAWAYFFAPQHYYEQKKRLFTYQLIPSMGSEDKKESQAQKILTKLKAIAEDKEEKSKKMAWEQERAEEEEEREKKILTTLFHTIAVFDKLIIDINSRRSQYQKG